MARAALPNARTDQLIIEDILDETVVYDLERDRAHCLNPAARLVWRACDGRTSAGDVAAKLGDVGLPADEAVVWMALHGLDRARLLAGPVEAPQPRASYNRREVIRALGIDLRRAYAAPARGGLDRRSPRGRSGFLHHPRAVSDAAQENLGLSDTTFIAASGIGNRIAVGEGATLETGRVILWNAATQTPSRAIEVVDLVNNANTRVLGLAMNQDGDLGAARGDAFVSFFDPELRLLGEVAITAGGGGVALHPLHIVNDDGTQPVGSRLAFVPVGNNTIEIYDTFNFTLLGRVHVKELIVGPVRATLPLNGENLAACTATAPITSGGYTGVDYTDAAAADSCIVVKLMGAAVGGESTWSTSRRAT